MITYWAFIYIWSVEEFLDFPLWNVLLFSIPQGKNGMEAGEAGKVFVKMTGNASETRYFTGHEINSRSFHYIWQSHE